MDVKIIHSYLVGIGKGDEEQQEVKGTKIENVGSLYNMLKSIFVNASSECKYEIVFMPNGNGEKKNECRDLIVNHLKERTFETGQILAKRLQSVTTHRSGLGLLFIIIGEDDGKDKIVISRFPADTGVLADEKQTTLNVEFVERVFMKNAKAYKSAVYVGTSHDSEFWSGRTIDKQISSDLTISDYWIKDFLFSDFATSGERGTKRLAKAIKDAINKGSEIEVKEELIAAFQLAKGLSGNMVSAESYSDRLGLSEEAKNAIRSEMRNDLFTEQFQLNFAELNRMMPYRTIEMNNGAFLTADIKKFDKVFEKSEEVNGNISFTTIGKVIDEKVKKLSN